MRFKNCAKIVMGQEQVNEQCACEWCVEHSDEMTFICKYSDKVYCKTCFECMMMTRDKVNVLLTLTCAVLGYTVFNLFVY